MRVAESRTVGRTDQMAAHPDTIFRPPNAAAQKGLPHDLFKIVL
jgi:hypothetical protein